MQPQAFGGLKTGIVEVSQSLFYPLKRKERGGKMEIGRYWSYLEAISYQEEKESKITHGYVTIHQEGIMFVVYLNG